MTTILFCVAISINLATGADLPASSDIKMLGEEESGGVVFSIGKSQVCIKIDGTSQQKSMKKMAVSSCAREIRRKTSKYSIRAILRPLARSNIQSSR